jgi:hypothetical protein
VVKLDLEPDVTEPWGRRALVSWARRLAAGAGYDVAVEESLRVHGVLNAVCRRREVGGPR